MLRLVIALSWAIISWTCLFLIVLIAINVVRFFLFGLIFLLLLRLVDHNLLHTLDHSLVAVPYHLVDAAEGGRALTHKARLSHCGPVSREEDAPLSAPLTDLDQFIFHEHALLDGAAFLERAHDVP